MQPSTGAVLQKKTEIIGWQLGTGSCTIDTACVRVDLATRTSASERVTCSILLSLSLYNCAITSSPSLFSLSLLLSSVFLFIPHMPPINQPKQSNRSCTRGGPLACPVLFLRPRGPTRLAQSALSCAYCSAQPPSTNYRSKSRSIG
jgi:hypothetical protein